MCVNRGSRKECASIHREDGVNSSTQPIFRGDLEGFGNTGTRMNRGQCGQKERIHVRECSRYVNTGFDMSLLLAPFEFCNDGEMMGTKGLW